MTDLLVLALVGVVLVATLTWVVRAGRPSGEAARSWAGVPRYDGPSRSSAALGGMVSAVAVTSAVSLTNASAATSASVGAILGALVAILVAVEARAVLTILFSVAGGLGVTSVILRFLGADDCSAVEAAARILAIILLVGAFSLGAVMTILGGRFRPHSVLSAFGAVKVLIFLHAPLGVQLADVGLAGWLLAPAAAVVFGVGAVIAPDLVIGASAIAVGLTSIAVIASLGAPCSLSADPREFLVVACYLAVFVVVRMIARMAPVGARQ